MPEPYDVDETGETCEHAGHEWLYAGGGMQICGVCQAERLAPEEDDGV